MTLGTERSNRFMPASLTIFLWKKSTPISHLQPRIAKTPILESERRAAVQSPREEVHRRHPSYPIRATRVIRPYESITAEMPVLAARMTGTPSSIARMRATKRCCLAPPKARTMRRRSRSQGRRGVPFFASPRQEQNLVADQRTYGRKPGHIECVRTIPECETAGYAGEFFEADRAQTFLERKVFPERHEMEFIVCGEQLAAAPENVEAVVIARFFAGFDAYRAGHENSAAFGSESISAAGSRPAY